MRVSRDEFFSNLNINRKYFLKKIKSFGVDVSSFYFSRNDLELIISCLPVNRYKSALVVERAKDLLGAKK